MKQISIFIIGSLILGACGKKNQRFQGEQINTTERSSKGVATYQSNGRSISTNVSEDVVVVPNNGSLRFKERNLLLTEKTEFIESGITFLTAPANFKLIKTEQHDGRTELPPDHLFLGSYQLPSTEYKLKINKNIIGTIEKLEKKTTAKYSALTGVIDLSNEFKLHSTEFELRASISTDGNKIYLYLIGDPNALSKLRYEFFQTGLPIREYNYPFCSHITFEIPIFGSNAVEMVTAKCDIEQNSCVIPTVFGMNQRLDIASVLNKPSAICNTYDYKLAAPRHQTEQIGLALKITEPRFVQIIPINAPSNANTELLDQKIEMPDLSFNFQK